MLPTNAPNYAIMTDNDHLKFPHGILLLRITSNLVICNHLLKVIEKCTNFYFGTEKLPPKF